MADFFKKIKRRFSNPAGKGLICSEIFESMAVLADGSVSCGCVDIFEGRALGNIHEKSLEEIFRSEPYKELRRRMISGDLPPQCRKCPLRVRPRTGNESTEGGSLEWIQLDPIFNCNLRCPDCALTAMRDNNYFIRPRTTLSLDSFKKIIDQAAPTLKHIRFHMLGEPFMNKKSGEMLAYARKKIPDVFISIETNGILMDSELCDVLVDNRIDYVKFSIDGASQETYEKYRVGGDFQKAYDNMAMLVQKRNSAGAGRPRIIWQYILLKWNDSDEEIRRAQKLAQKAGVDELYWLLTHSSAASERFLPGKDYPIFQGDKQSLNETIEIAARKGEPLIRPKPNLEEYDPWK